jgi:hypothetical protein
LDDVRHLSAEARGHVLSKGHTDFMLGELGRKWSLPLLPTGTAMFEGLPLRALVLDALAPAVGSGTITLHDGEREGVLVIRDGVVSETVWVSGGVRADGDETLAIMNASKAATVSACRLSDDAIALVGTLIRGDPCYADLRLEWVVWPRLVQDLRDRGETFVIELSTPTGRGVTVIQNGRQVATFAESHPALGTVDLLDDLATGGVGTIRVLVDRDARGGLQSAEPSFAASSLEAPRPEFLVLPSTIPTDTDTDHSNATLSALFGPHHDASGLDPRIGIDGIGPRGMNQVESLLPQLKLLVQDRLQRSSGTVEEVVEAAAKDRQSVEWLADRVRVMTVRGFLHSTFDQLADDMLALSARTSG